MELFKSFVDFFNVCVHDGLVLFPLFLVTPVWCDGRMMWTNECVFNDVTKVILVLGIHILLIISMYLLVTSTLPTCCVSTKSHLVPEYSCYT